MTKQYNLERFVEAQQSQYETALAEIRRGRKQSHWMWYIFPQIQGLGFSEMSRYYAIEDLREAEAYLQHPVLGSRLTAICHELLRLPSGDAGKVFGTPDDMKLKSSMTLFSSVRQADPVFRRVLEKFFQGAKDGKTLQIIDRQQ
jgi:uncharacterized protein (DUF1810 family)